MGILYIIYGRDINRGFIGGIYKGNICITWGINEDYIGLRPKVYGSILGNLYSKTRNLNGDFNSILPINE